MASLRKFAVLYHKCGPMPISRAGSRRAFSATWKSPWAVQQLILFPCLESLILASQEAFSFIRCNLQPFHSFAVTFITFSFHYII